MYLIFTSNGMSKLQLERTLKRELKILNEKIDYKIVRGLSYSLESRRHKMLLNKLAKIRGAADNNWFTKVFGTFIFS